MKSYLIIDFDSTFVSGEAFDELARIVLRDAPDRRSRVAEIEAITRAGMEGKIGFDESLRRRIRLLAPNGEQLRELVKALLETVTPSVASNRAFLTNHASHIYIVSGGFREFVVPVVREFGIAADHVLANNFVRNDAGAVIGFDEKNPLARDGGKPGAVAAMNLDGPIVMVGDAVSDYEVRAEGVADVFVAFIENVKRPGVPEAADFVAENFDDVINSDILAELQTARV